MKKLVLSCLLALPLFSQASFITNCDSISGRNDTLTFFINNGTILQTRIQAPGSLVHVLMTTLIGQVGSENIYSIAGVADLMHVDQSVLEGNGGYVHLNTSDYSCLAN